MDLYDSYRQNISDYKNTLDLYEADLSCTIDNISKNEILYFILKYKADNWLNEFHRNMNRQQELKIDLKKVEKEIEYLESIEK